MVRQGRMLQLVTATVAMAFLCASFAQAAPSNRWRMQFSGASRAPGVLTLRLSPVGGTPLTVEINIPGDLRENSVARVVVGELERQLPAESFQVERDDGEDVLIRKRRGTADFDLEVVSNTIEHVRINLDRE